MTLLEKELGQKDSILIVGADGLIGRSLVSSFEAEGKTVWQTTRRPNQLAERRVFLDLSEETGDWSFPSDTIRTVLLCAAVTSVERCEREPECTRRANVLGTVGLVERLVKAGVFVIFLSSNLVFDGTKPFAKHTDLVNPKTEYGRQKAEAEARLLALGDRVSIVRFAKVMSSEIPLFQGWIRDLQAGNIVHPFADMVMAPVSLAFAVEVLQAVSERLIPGIIQVSATQDITYADAAQFIAGKICGDTHLVEPMLCREADVYFSPEHTTLDSAKLAEVGLYVPHPLDTIDQLLSQTSL